VRKELQPWKRQFPNDFYKRIFELNEWPYDPKSLARPGVIGIWTNDIIYDRLGPGIRKLLHEYAGRNEKGRLNHQPRAEPPSGGQKKRPQRRGWMS
jgi:hypothetical protein